MEDFAAMIAGLHGFSVVIGLGFGLVGGFVFAMLTYRFYGKNFRNTFDQLSDEMKKSYEGAAEEMKSSFKSLSSEALTSSQQEFLSLADRELDKKTEQHSTELESKKELIGTQLQSMSKAMTETLNKVPADLEKNEKNVGEALNKSTKELKESNQSYLSQLTEKADAQTKAHSKELTGKKELIDQRLNDMDSKLGKVEKLVQDLQTDREKQYGALGQQLQQLTSTTSSLQKALADNRARGQWGERIAEDMLKLMGMVEGVNYYRQKPTPSGERPDFTIELPNQKKLNIDVKFPLDNYLRYIETENERERTEYSDEFLRNIRRHVTTVSKRDYINPQTVDCVLIFIPNEQIYHFIHDRDSSQDRRIIDNALEQKVVLCSPLTFYIVIAVIRQAVRDFNIEQKSREIVNIVQEIRKEWEGKDKFTHEWRKLESHLSKAQKTLNSLTTTRTSALDRKFNRIEGILESNQIDGDVQSEIPRLAD